MYSWADGQKMCTLISMSSIGGPPYPDKTRSAAECCQAFLDGDLNTFPSPLQMACQSGEEYIWEEETDTCTKTQLFFDNDGSVIDEFTVFEKIDKDGCCKAGFE